MHDSFGKVSSLLLVSVLCLGYVACNKDDEATLDEICEKAIDCGWFGDGDAQNSTSDSVGEDEKTMIRQSSNQMEACREEMREIDDEGPGFLDCFEDCDVNVSCDQYDDCVDACEEQVFDDADEETHPDDPISEE